MGVVAPALSDTAIDALLARWPVARLATLRPDGRPHLVPIVFAWVGGALWSPVDAKPKRPVELERLRNLRRDPRVTLLLDDYREDWRQLWWIRLEGRAELRPVPVPEAGETGRAAAALRAKYPQYGSTALFLGVPTLIRVEIEVRRGWCADLAVLGRAEPGPGGEPTPGGAVGATGD